MALKQCYYVVFVTFFTNKETWGIDFYDTVSFPNMGFMSIANAEDTEETE